MSTAITNSTNEIVKERVQKWLQSTEGQKAIQETLQKTKNITTRLQEERRVEIKSLHEPFTV